MKDVRREGVASGLSRREAHDTAERPGAETAGDDKRRRPRPASRVAGAALPANP